MNACYQVGGTANGASMLVLLTQAHMALLHGQGSFPKAAGSSYWMLVERQAGSLVIKEEHILAQFSDMSFFPELLAIG